MLWLVGWSVLCGYSMSLYKRRFCWWNATSCLVYDHGWIIQNFPYHALIKTRSNWLVFEFETGCPKRKICESFQCQSRHYNRPFFECCFNRLILESKSLKWHVRIAGNSPHHAPILLHLFYFFFFFLSWQTYFPRLLRSGWILFGFFPCIYMEMKRT